MGPTHDSMKKVCILLSSVLGGVIALILILLLALAPVAEYVINHYGPEIVGREATVGKVRINPLRAASVSVYDFHLKEQNELTDFAAFDTLYVDMNLFALMHKEVYLRQVTVKNFTGEVLRTNDRFNFTDIIEHFQTPDSLRQESDSTPSAWKISLRNIDIIRSRVEYRDVIRDDRWELNDININIPGLYFGGNRASNAGITFQFQRGGSVGIMADYTMATNAFSVHLHMDSVSADVAQPFVRPMLNIQSLGGTVSGDLSADGNLSRPSDTRLGGWVSLDSIRIESESGDCPLAFRRLYAALGSINLETMHFDLDTIVLTDLTAGYSVYGDQDNTLSRLLVADSTYQEADTIASNRGTAELDIETTHRELYLTVKLAQIQNAAVHYLDAAMSPEFAYQITNLNVKAFHLSNHASNQVKLTANVGSKGRLEGHYKGDLDIANGRENLDLMLQQVDMSEFSPYSESLMAYPLQGGSLSLRSTTAISQGKIDSRNRIEIDRMEVGKKIIPSKAPYKAIPLKLGVGLLKSSAGLIVIDLPVSGDLSNPKFKFRQVILRALAKVFFGPMMGLADKAELAELAHIVDDPELHSALEHRLDSIESIPADSIQSDTIVD